MVVDGMADYFTPSSKDWTKKEAFTGLLCFLGEQEQRMDLSHPVHADNCVLDPDTGECWREPPAYTYRDYRWAALPGVRQVGLGWDLTASGLLPPVDSSTSMMTSRVGTYSSQSPTPSLSG